MARVVFSVIAVALILCGIGLLLNLLTFVFIVMVATGGAILGAMIATREQKPELKQDVLGGDEYNTAAQYLMEYADKKGLNIRLETASSGIVKVVAVHGADGVMIDICDFVLPAAEPHCKEWLETMSMMTMKIDEFIERTNESSES